MENYLENAPCLFFACKDDGSIVNVNETLCRQLLFTKEELVGKNIETLFTVATKIFQQTHFFPLLKMHGHAEEIYITLKTKEGDHLPLLINAERGIVNDEAISTYIGIVVHNRKMFEEELIAAEKAAEKALHENTDLKKAKEELQHHTEQLDRQIAIVNNQNKELRQFNHVVTHDMQEPLRKLSVFYNLLMETDDAEKQKSIIDKLIKVTDQMKIVINGLQQYVWLTEVETRVDEVDINAVLQLLHHELKQQFPDVNIQLQADDLPTIYADSSQIKLLFHHLLLNAIRFRKDGHTVNITIEGNTLMLNSFRYIKDKYKFNEFLKIRLKDNGIGFDADNKDQVFQLFKKLHAESGQGVGLALCKKITDNHQGFIAIDSKKDEGTVVTIELPVLKEAKDQF